MHTNSIHRALSSRLHTASPVHGRHIRSVAVKIDQDDTQTAWITITDHIDAGDPTDRLFSFSWIDDLIVDHLTNSVIQAYLYTLTGDEYIARELAPHLGMDYTGKADE